MLTTVAARGRLAPAPGDRARPARYVDRSVPRRPERRRRHPHERRLAAAGDHLTTPRPGRDVRRDPARAVRVSGRVHPHDGRRPGRPTRASRPSRPRRPSRRRADDRRDAAAGDRPPLRLIDGVRAARGDRRRPRRGAAGSCASAGRAPRRPVSSACSATGSCGRRSSASPRRPTRGVRRCGRTSAPSPERLVRDRVDRPRPKQPGHGRGPDGPGRDIRLDPSVPAR